MSDDALAADARTAEDAAETALAARILIITAALLILAVVTVSLFGLPALGFMGLAATFCCFAVLLAFMLSS